MNALLRDVGSKAQISNLPKLIAGNVPNAMAAIFGRTRVIAYSPMFLAQLRQASGKAARWALRFVFAHELGHHIEGHTITMDGSNWKAEYEADSWAAHILRRMGASLAETSAAMKAMPVPPSATHPGTEERLANIRKAYGDTDGIGPGVGDDPTDQTGTSAGPSGPVDTQPTVPIQQSPGYPRQTQIEPCGCRYLPRQTAPAQVCASGRGIAIECPGYFCSSFPPIPATAAFCL